MPEAGEKAQNSFVPAAEALETSNPEAIKAAAGDGNNKPTPTTAGDKNYSSFTQRQKYFIVSMGMMAAFFSPLSSNIYVPALNTLAADFGVSVSLINLTVTTYLIFQGIAPAFTGTFADDAGRRPAYIVCFVIYLVANLGLALQRSYPALLVLRMVQSAGCSGTVALATGVIADCITSAERGMYVGITSIPSVLGPSVAPLLGGVISQYLGWPWIFWFLLILAAAYFVVLLVFMPETCRKIVDDGSVPPPLLNHSLISYLRERRAAAQGIEVDYSKRAELLEKRRLRFPNPFRTLRIILTPFGSILLSLNGVIFSVYYAVAVSIPQQFSQRYGFDDLHVSLMFLPVAGGILFSAIYRGRAIDKNYAKHAQRLGMPLDKKKAQDLTNFPIERARIEVGMPAMLVGVGAVIGFGWSLQANAHVAVPIIMLFLIGFCITAGFNMMSILIVDVNRESASMATAANNLVRCLLGAAATAINQPIVNAIGIGWTCTLFALVWLVWIPLLFVLIRKGPQWRKDMAAKKVEREDKKLAKIRDVEKAGVDVPRISDDRRSKSLDIKHEN